MILPIHTRVKFLGFRVFFHHRLLKKSNINQFFRRFEELEQNFYDDLIDEIDFETRIESWLVHAKWAKTNKLQWHVKERLNNQLIRKKLCNIY